MIYLDHAASAPPYNAVCTRVGDIMSEHYANPGAIHAAAAPVRRILRESRQTMAALTGFADSAIYFTSGGTESNNIAIRASALASSRRQILVGATEHKSVLLSAFALREQGYRVDVIPADSCGRILPEKVAALATADTALVSVQAANNETGTVQDIAGIAAAAHACGALYHCDAVQSFGHIALDLSVADLVSLSAHKFGGPRGVGLLAVRSGITLSPLFFGGGQEKGLRSGTENLPGIAGMALAASLAAESLESERERLAALSEELLTYLYSNVNGLILNSGDAERLPGILNLRFPGISAEELTARLSERWICVSPGAACAAGEAGPSHVLLAMGLSETEASSSIRISSGRGTTQREITAAAEAIAEICAKYAAR